MQTLSRVMTESERLSDEAYQALLLYMQELLEEAEALDPRGRELVFELMKAVDGVHREAFTRMIEAFAARAPEVMATLENDMAVGTLLSFYELLEPPSADGFVAVEDVEVLETFGRPIWLPAGRAEDLEPGRLVARRFEEVSVVMGRVGDEVFALRNACLGSILTLQQGRLEGRVLICPWHGCRYDVFTGELEGRPGALLEKYPVQKDEGGDLHLGFNIS